MNVFMYELIMVWQNSHVIHILDDAWAHSKRNAGAPWYTIYICFGCAIWIVQNGVAERKWNCWFANVQIVSPSTEHHNRDVRVCETEASGCALCADVYSTILILVRVTVRSDELKMIVVDGDFSQWETTRMWR